MAGRKTPSAQALRPLTKTSEFKIDDAVPAPAIGKRVGASVQLREALLKMAVGQSTTVPVDPDTGRAAVRLSNALRGVTDDREFMQRKQTEDGREVVRIWRTK